MKRRLILFDLDDTLFPSQAAYQAGLQAAWRRLKKEKNISWAAFNRLYARARSEVKKRLGTSPTARNRLLYFKRLVEILFDSPRPRVVLSLMAAYNTCWKKADVREARDVLRYLARRFTLGIVTNQVAEMQMRKLSVLDPRGRWLKIVVTSEEWGVEKPSSRLFREACRLAGCKPSETWLVGDSWKDDVQGGRKAGLRVAFLCRTPSRKSVLRGVYPISTLSDLKKW